MGPLISVVVPVWNVEKYLHRCIDSIINQTYENIEIILVDDGSTDNSGTICDTYAKIDGRIKVIHKENGGAVSARKEGIVISKGEYIAFVDSDDYINSDMYQHMLEMMIAHGVDLVTVGIKFDYGNDSIVDINTNMPPKGIYYRNGNEEYSICKKLFNLNNHTPVITSYNCDKLYKREFMEKYYMTLPDIVFAEDALFLYSFVPFIHSLYVSDKVYYYYNQLNDNSVSKRIGNNIRFVSDLLIIYDKLKKIYKDHESEENLINQLNKFILKLLFSALPKSMTGNLITYLFPVEKIKDKKILIYGAGVVGTSYYNQISKDNIAEIVCVTDELKANHTMGLHVICNIESALQKDFDYIVIAVLKKTVADEIIDTLINKYHISSAKILWEVPSHIIDENLIQ